MSDMGGGLKTITTDQARTIILGHTIRYDEKWAEIQLLDAIMGRKLIALQGPEWPPRNMEEAQERIRHVKKSNYERDLLHIETTRLSAALKFGVLSILQAYYMYDNESYRRELYWREFFYQYTHISALSQVAHDNRFNTLEYGLKTRFTINAHEKPAFRRGYPLIGHGITVAGKDNWELFDQWRTGRTGYPVVDAAMRELAATGYMHNRARMIVASFLTKTLVLPWQWGEMHFAQLLVDYDPIQNNGGWQSVAGSGPFSMPYFRVFNPVTNQVKHDPDAHYIRKWVIELRQWTNKKEIHNVDSHIIHDPTIFKARMDSASKERAVERASTSTSSSRSSKE